MASTPQFKIYDSAGVYQAACKEIEAAAVLITFYGTGATIRDGHSRIVWAEGHESQSAYESLDFVAETVNNRGCA
jgi:hypothetical protein